MSNLETNTKQFEKPVEQSENKSDCAELKDVLLAQLPSLEALASDLESLREQAPEFVEQNQERIDNFLNKVRQLSASTNAETE